MFKKFLTKVVIAVFAFTSLGVFSSLEVAAVTSFTDVAVEDINYEAIEYLQDEGVVVGYEDGSYGEDLPINRAEFLKIVMEVSGNEIVGSNCFPDVKEEWFAPYICKASELGLVEGYPDGMFRPGQNINFAEASKIIVNTLDIDVDDPYADVWFKHFVYGLEDHAAIPETISAFDQSVDRGEMAEMIFRLDAEIAGKLSGSYEEVEAGVPPAEVGEELRDFRSCEALETQLTANDYYYDYGYGLEEVMIMEDDGGLNDAVLAPEANQKSEATTGSALGEADISSTNVQVKGVDEADIVKTDGEYIYIVGDYTVRVVKAYTPDTMTEVDEVQFGDESFYPSDMYVDGDRLVVLGYSYEALIPYETSENEESLGYYDYYYDDITRVYIFDISDPENVELIRTTSFEGSYATSRKIDDMVYVVLNRYNYSYYGGVEPVAGNLVPRFSDSANEDVAPLSECSDVKYVPGGDSSSFLVVAGISVDDMDAEVSREVVLGSSGEVYSSRDNLYVAEPKYGWNYWEDGDETIVHKFDLDKTDIDYEGKGKVPGYLQNQFSMDENGEYFRIATTKGDNWNADNPLTNNVYVLDGDLNLVGSLEGLAPGESIYSVRFMGDRAYMVTFKKVDPLFVIDLADPTNPSVLGKLKIPGFSDYLHPYDENHIIGVGKEAVDAGENETFAWYQGMKIAMFDVTDVENPKELHKYEIGDRGTDSELLWNHKALLFDKEKGIMAFPVTLAEIPEEVKNDPDTPDNAYGDYTFQGAYVFDVSVEDGFDLRGTITHYDNNEVEDLSGYYWYGLNDIYRILYIGDYFYTVSDGMVKASNMSNLSEVNSVELEVEEYYKDDYFWEDLVF